MGRVERGQRPQPWRFGSQPRVSRLETEKGSKPQVLQSVGLTAAREKYDSVKVNLPRGVTVSEIGSPKVRVYEPFS
jgi:hypothetical protein